MTKGWNRLPIHNEGASDDHRRAYEERQEARSTWRPRESHVNGSDKFSPLLCGVFPYLHLR